MKATTSRRVFTIFAFVILVTEILVFRFAAHRILWTIGLTAVIPLAAAIIGGFSDADLTRRP